jgi:catechol 2,3-dioxygenase-like lactoylglutathione lyase family enzyme
MASSGVRFARAVLMVRGSEGVSRAVDFYHNALGLAIVRHTDEWAELTCGKAFSIHLQSVSSEAQLCTAYSPLLTFEVNDFDRIIQKCAQMGAHLDGPIQYPAHGKVASLRSPDGHMIGIYEPAII